MSKRKLVCIVSFVFICSGVSSIHAQAGIDTIQVPGELSGPEPNIPTISQTDKPYAEAFVSLLKDMKLEESDLPRLDQFLTKYPKNDIVYFWRATIEACKLQPRKSADATRDLDHYLSNERSDLFPSQETDALSLLAKIEVSQGHQLAALALMKKAAELDLRKADNLFSARGIKPQTTSILVALQ